MYSGTSEEISTPEPAGSNRVETQSTDGIQTRDSSVDSMSSIEELPSAELDDTMDIIESCGSRHVADELFPALDIPIRPDFLQETSKFFVADTYQDLRDAVYFVLYHLSGSVDNVDPSSGKHMDCRLMPSTHLLPRWVMSYHCNWIRYKLADEERTEKIVHVLRRDSPGLDNRSKLQISHLCHTAYCVNPNHITFEDSQQNVSRNYCGPDACSHYPKCVIRGCHLFRSKTDNVFTKGRRNKYRIGDEIFPKLNPPTWLVDVEPDARCLRIKSRAELQKILYSWIFHFCGSSDQVDADSKRHMECKSPPPTHLLPPWLVYHYGRLHVKYYDGNEKRMELLMHLYFFYGDPNFESLQKLDISHRCHRYWCLNPLHILMESPKENIRRNACGPTEHCKHEVKCAISGGVFYRQRKALSRCGYDYQGGPLRCNKQGCSSTSSMVSHLVRHLKSCWGIKDEVCPECDRTFSNDYCVRQHFKFMHSDEKPYRCSICLNIACKTKKELEIHNTRHHNPNREIFTCEICFKQFFNWGTLRNHMKFHNDPSSLKCPICGNQLESEPTLKRHLLKHVDIECCGFSFDNERLYQEHLPAHDSMPYCQVCGKSFESQAKVWKHFNHMHSEVRAYKCPQEGCNKTCVTPQALKAHVTNEHKEKKFKCHCGKALSSKYELKKHKQRQHPDPKEYPVECHHCHQRFKADKDLESHLKDTHFPAICHCRADGCGIPYNSAQKRNGHEKKAHGKLQG